MLPAMRVRRGPLGPLGPLALIGLIGLLGFGLLALLAPREARADFAADGRWRQGPLREELTVRQWLPECGPEPQSSTTGGGEVVNVRLEGDELAFVGGGRVYRTNQCYDAMPTLARETHSRDPGGKTWRTRCTTPAGDPRRAVLNTLVVATTDTHLDVVETGRYEIIVANGTCMADVKRTRGWDLVQDDKPAPSATAKPAPEPKPEPRPQAKACDAPGEPSRLEVRPSRKLLRTGESFQLHAVVLDGQGCDTRTATAWKVAPGADGRGVTVDATGKVAVAADAPEGSVEVVATAAGKDTRVTIEVTKPANYDELLARSGLDESGENDAASVVSIGTQSIGAGEGRVEDRARVRREVFVAAVAAALVVLGGLALVLLRRKRSAEALARDAELRHEQRVDEVMRRRKARADEHAAQLQAHEASVAAARAAAERASSRGAGAVAVPAATAPRKGADMACRTCGKEFDAPLAFCPHDGSALEPLRAGSAALAPALAAAARHVGVGVGVAAERRRGKICPTCGDRFEGNDVFCGKDGTQLVLIN
jgi:hypothetical protein